MPVSLVLGSADEEAREMLAEAIRARSGKSIKTVTS